MIGTLQEGGTQDTDLENTRDELFTPLLRLEKDKFYSHKYYSHNTTVYYTLGR